MKRKLRRLRKRADQDQQQRRRVEGRGADRLAALDDLADFISAGRLPQQQQAGDQREAAAAGDFATAIAAAADAVGVYARSVEAARR